MTTQWTSNSPSGSPLVGSWSQSCSPAGTPPHLLLQPAAHDGCQPPAPKPTCWVFKAARPAGLTAALCRRCCCCCFCCCCCCCCCFSAAAAPLSQCLRLRWTCGGACTTSPKAGPAVRCLGPWPAAAHPQQPLRSSLARQAAAQSRLGRHVALPHTQQKYLTSSTSSLRAPLPLFFFLRRFALRYLRRQSRSSSLNSSRVPPPAWQAGCC